MAAMERDRAEAAPARRAEEREAALRAVRAMLAFIMAMCRSVLEVRREVCVMDVVRGKKEEECGIGRTRYRKVGRRAGELALWLEGNVIGV